MTVAPSDEQLAQQALGGDEAAFAELLRRFERPVFSLILRMVRDRPTAEDLAQEAFVKAFRNLHRFDPGRKFSGWMFKIAHNQTLDHLRRKTPDSVSLDASDEDDSRSMAANLQDEKTRSPEVEAARGDLRQQLEAAIGELRVEHREVFLLRFSEGLAYQEIAEATALPIGTVKTYIHRARKRLAHLLEAAGWDAGDRVV